MTINYTEKGIWLHDEINRQGYTLAEVDGTWISSNDVAVQSIIDTFDPLPFARAEKIKELQQEGLRRANNVYGDIVFENVGSIKVLIDIDATYTRPGALAPRLADLAALNTAIQSAVAAINSEPDWQVVMAYDVVDQPPWPSPEVQG